MNSPLREALRLAETAQEILWEDDIDPAVTERLTKVFEGAMQVWAAYYESLLKGIPLEKLVAR